MQVTSAATPPFTPTNLISNIFLGDGVEVLSISFNGKPVSVGYFTNGTQAVGLQRGIVMTTGLAETTNPSAGPFGAEQVGSVFASNNVGGIVPTTDPNLSPIASGPLFDVTGYTIRFIPTADTLRFRYCFASEEYPEFACSEYNDIFGFFISGPGYPTPTNIARIPGTTLPVAINNLHPDNTTPARPCPPKNALFYINNLNSNKQPTYDGLTRVFTAEAIVTPCDTYVIRLVIADVGDPIYDSGVFLEAKSFGTGAIRTALTTPNLDGVIVEGCAAATLTFRLPIPDTADVPLDYKIFGTATNGVDVAPIPTHAVIPAGKQEVSITITALEDGLAEGEEWIAIDVRRDPCHRDTFLIIIRENALAPPTLPDDTLFCKGANNTLTLNGTLPIPLPSPPFFENTQPLQIHPVNVSVTSSLAVSGVSPPTVQPGMIRSVCLNITHGWVDDIDAYLIAPGGQILELMTDCGANGKNFTQTCFTPTATRSIASATAANAPFTGEWQPEGPWSDLWGSPTNGTWRLVLRDDQNGFIGTLQRWSITFEPSYRIEYRWTPAAGVSCPTCPIVTVAPTDTATYTVVATDSYGCTVSDSTIVNAAAALPAPQVSCGAYTPSSVAFSWAEVPGAVGYLVNVGGTGWVPANESLGHTVSGLTPGAVVSIAVQAISATPCPAAVATATCSNCDQPAVSALVTDATCATAANGRIVLQPDGKNPPYSFILGANANTTGVFDQLAPGTYVARITDGSGCQRQLSVVVGSPPPLAVSLVEKPVTCFGGDDGALRAEVSGGVPPYQYLWNDPQSQTQPTAVNLRAKTYAVTVSDRNGCTATATAALTSPTEIVLSVAAVAARCHGEASGVATVTAAGGVGPYQYQWAGGQTTNVAVGLPAGTHGVTITDAAGCAKATFALITQPPPLTLNATATHPTCANGANGSASVSAQGGTGALSYAWSTTPVQNTAVVTQLASGNYTVTVGDQNGCTATASVTLQAPPAIAVALAPEDARCHGQPSGNISATAQGGTGTLAYAWSTTPAQSTPTAINLTAGTYTVTISDQNGCTATASATVGQPAPLAIGLSLQNVRCFGENTGGVLANASGGVAPYTYAWSSSETTPNLVQKAAGIYTLTLTDANGCTAIAKAPIEQPPALQLTAQQQNIACHGQNTGRISVSPSGGIPPYAALWSGPGVNGDTRTVLDQLSAGQYALTLTDANGCTQTQTFTLLQPPAPLTVALAPAADTLCAEQASRNVSASAAGGTPPYAYTWSVGAQTAPSAALPPGSHALTVSDANGCTATAAAQIVQQPPLSLQVALEKVDCASGGSAFVASATYGTAPADLNRLTFQWNTSPPQAGIRAGQLAPGQTYAVTATDPRGCTAVQSIAVPAALTVRVAIARAASPRCFGGADGQLVASASGGTPPYVYAWSGGVAAADSAATGLRAGAYTVTVSDRAGCTGTASATLSQPPALKARLQAEAVRCFGETTGALSAAPEGGVPPYQFAWPTGQSGPRAAGLSAGAYALTLTDANGCTLVTLGDVPQPAPLTGTATKKDVLCFGTHTGEIAISAEGGTPPYRYALDNAAWNGAARQIGLPAGTYVPRITDRNGCTVALPPVTLEQRPPLMVKLGPDTTLRFGQNATLQTTVSNAEPPLQYAWSAEDAPWLSCTDCPDPTVQALAFTRWFTVRVTDAFGCIGVGRLRVEVEKRWNAYVPTAFSPNGDGNNDLLLVHGSPGTRVLTFDVYDRWGERVFSAAGFAINDPDTGWDGTFRGQPLNPGVFVWVLQVEWPDGSQETLQGQTLLTR
ncbi:MAG: choice-of-anchor L domain-containing protein [Saprospiraceae bacterium]|nr:choice-of-anchor L domain-containing protein [Saprospiraceae bacterium]MDW8228483.1 choice-of-anchor L domain-containing protein [Saprospiraceae bacterium]